MSDGKILRILIPEPTAERRKGNRSAPPQGGGGFPRLMRAPP
jgi:hypothetical protein